MKVAFATGAMGATVFVVSLLRLIIVLYHSEWYGHTYKHIPTEWVGWVEFSLFSSSLLVFSSLFLFVP